MTEQTTPKKVKIPRQDMPRQDPKIRITNFSEVALGYTTEQALLEARRCIQCKKPLCVKGCPVEIDIPGFIKLIAEEKFVEAARKIKEANSLPAMCGRVCPQEEQCEIECILGKKGEPVAIGRLERFVADYEMAQGEPELPSKPPATGKKVAVVGSGPAGLAVAGELIKLGHDVTIFEALHKPGGVLMYGIPEFRLPKAIVEREVDYLKRLGVKLETNCVIGKLYTVDELMKEEGYDTVFVANGAGLPWFMGIDGENLSGVYSANEYLTRSNLMKAYLFPEYDTPIIVGKNVAVIGGGNVAMDAARTAKRLGSNVYLIYRRSRHEMPARKEEVENAEEEGIDFRFLTNPIRLIGDENGCVRQVECLRMELGEPDDSGRRRPVPVKGSEFLLDIDVFIVAIGNGPNPLISSTTPDMQTNRKGYFIADEETMSTTKPGVFAGGDIVTGSATVISAMGAAKKAARAIHAYLMGTVQ